MTDEQALKICRDLGLLPEMSARVKCAYSVLEETRSEGAHRTSEPAGACPAPAGACSAPIDWYAVGAWWLDAIAAFEQRCGVENARQHQLPFLALGWIEGRPVPAFAKDEGTMFPHYAVRSNLEKRHDREMNVAGFAQALARDAKIATTTISRQVALLRVGERPSG